MDTNLVPNEDHNTEQPTDPSPVGWTKRLRTRKKYGNFKNINLIKNFEMKS